MTTTDELPESPNRSGDHVLQENTTSTSTGELANVPLTGADKVAYAFYATAATAALVGQVWAGVTHIPWPDEGFSPFLKIALVTPAVAVIELGGVATAALADLRRRKGEQAYAYRAMSLFAAIVALVFNVVGHWRPEERFLAFGFGGLSAFAYVLWLIHSSARRRDALRKAGQMATTGPVYGVVQWVREPKVTWSARAIALEHGLGLYESIRAARVQRRNNARRDAIAGTVAEYIRSEHQDERLAKIAETTYDADRLAGMLEDRINYEVITNKLTLAISPPPPPEPEPVQEERTDLRAAVWVVEGTTPPPVQQIPVQQLPPQPARPAGGVPLRDDEQWGEAMTGELMAVDYLPYDRSTEEADDAEVVEEAAAAAAVAAAQQPVVAKPRPESPFVQHPVDEQPPAVDQRRVVQPRPAAAKPAPAAAPKPAAAKKAAAAKKTVVRNSVPQSAAPVPVVDEPVIVTPAPVAAVEEPTVVAREVSARTASTSSRPAPRPKSSSNGSGGDLEKKRMRAWALLSDWPEDRPRTAATLASAIASSESDAERLLTEYDAEHGNSNLTLVANSQN